MLGLILKVSFALLLIRQLASETGNNPEGAGIAGREGDVTKKLVCYYNVRATLRQQDGIHPKPDNIHPNLCNHIIIRFLNIEDDLTIGENLLNNPHVNNSLNKLKNSKLRNPDLKILISIGKFSSLIEGSSSESVQTDAAFYSRIASLSDSRAEFISSVVRVLEKHNFDGLEVAWAFPGLIDPSGSDKENFSLLLREISKVLSPKRYLVSIPMPPNKDAIDVGYNIEEIGQYLDFINLHSFDYFGPWDKKTFVHAPMYWSKLYPETQKLNIDLTINHLLKSRLNPAKILLGISTYARVYTLADSKVATLGSRTNDSRIASSANSKDTSWLWSMNDLCERMKSGGWKVVRDSQLVSSYASRNDIWVSFEDQWSVINKTNYAKAKMLGGVFVMSVDTDDYNGFCNKGKYPLIQAIKSELYAEEATVDTPFPTTNEVDIYSASIQPPTINIESDSPQSTPTQLPVTRSTVPPTPYNREKAIICYYDHLSLERSTKGRLSVEHIDASSCTHLVYSYVTLDSDYELNPPEMDYGQKDEMALEALVQLLEMKTEYSGLKVLVSIGNAYDNASKYRAITSTRESRSILIDKILKYLKTYHLDGCSIDWKPIDHKENFAIFSAELKNALASHEYQLMAAISPVRSTLDKWYDIENMSKYFDYINVRAHNLLVENELTLKTRLHAPIFSFDPETPVHLTSNWTINYLIHLGATRSKLTLGLAFNGESYSLSYKQLSRPGIKAEEAPGNHYTEMAGMIGYNEICDKLRTEPEFWNETRDEKSNIPYISNDQGLWISYDDPSSISTKVDYVFEMDLAGVSLFSLDLDDFNGECGTNSFPLTRAAWERLSERINESSQTAIYR